MTDGYGEFTAILTSLEVAKSQMLYKSTLVPACQGGNYMEISSWPPRRARIRLGWDASWSQAPAAATRPLSNTTMRSAIRTVESRWAITTTVKSRGKRRTAS